MKVAVLGGGPAGLYFAISIKLRNSAHEVTVIERNKPDDTFGWGVVLSALPILKGRPDAADWLRRLREAALKDEKGDMLDGALKTVATLDDKPA